MEGTIQIQVSRDACCSQDDQIGPLEAAYTFGPHATVIDLVRAVVSSRFLQFSSSHQCLTASISGVPLAKVCASDHGPVFAPVFLVAPETLLAPLAEGRVVEFRFT
jgi:hypothetical protein